MQLKANEATSKNEMQHIFLVMILIVSCLHIVIVLYCVWLQIKDGKNLNKRIFIFLFVRRDYNDFKWLSKKRKYNDSIDTREIEAILVTILRTLRIVPYMVLAKCIESPIGKYFESLMADDFTIINAAKVDFWCIWYKMYIHECVINVLCLVLAESTGFSVGSHPNG